MKYKSTIKENEIDIATGTSIYGPFIIAKEYNYVLLEDIPCIIATGIKKNDKHQYEKYYGTVDENILFKDVNKYGKKLYAILKNNLNPLYKHNSMLNIKHRQLVGNKDITKNKDEVVSICLEFINEYGLSINMRELMDYTDNKQYKNLALKYGNTFVPLELLVNEILIYYILHLIFVNLITGYKSNETAYKILSIDNSIDSLNIFEANIKIIEILTGFISSRFLPLNESRHYLLKIIKAYDDTIIPIRYTFNLFTFCLEMMVNNVSTLSFKVDNNTFEETTYYIIRKCKRCLSNAVDIKTIGNNKKIPTTQKKYCDDCEHEMKLERNRKYERSLRTIYDQLKENVDKCTPELANEIRNLKPKDKETKSHLMRLYNQFKNDSK